MNIPEVYCDFHVFTFSIYVWPVAILFQACMQGCGVSFSHPPLSLKLYLTSIKKQIARVVCISLILHFSSSLDMLEYNMIRSAACFEVSQLEAA
jgi:hypothetical protein